MLLEYAAAGSRLLIRRGLLRPEQRREPELVDLPLGQLTRTPWRQMATKISVTAWRSQIEVGNYLLGFTAVRRAGSGREPRLTAAERFSRQPGAPAVAQSPARLEQLLTGTLDLCSHRLDAWITSLATKRLAEMRQERAGRRAVRRLRLGDEPAARRRAHAEVAPPPGEQAPVFRAAEQSRLRSHAVAGAGYHRRRAAQRSSGPRRRSNAERSAGDRSVVRARAAGDAGCSTACGRGSRSARCSATGSSAGCRKPEKRIFIDVLPRSGAAGGAQAGTQARQPVEAIAANNVVDGLELQRRWLAVQGMPPLARERRPAGRPVRSASRQADAGRAQRREQCVGSGTERTGRCGRRRQRRADGRNRVSGRARQPAARRQPRWNRSPAAKRRRPSSMSCARRAAASR